MIRNLFAIFIVFALLPAISCTTGDLSAPAETSSVTSGKPLTGASRQPDESEPVESPLVATVLGENIYTNDPVEMQDILLTQLFNQYAKEKGVTVSAAEIEAFVEGMRRGMRASGLTAEVDLTTKEADQAAQMRRDMGRAMIRQWKLNRALYQQYGGRIIYQQFGPEPIDAYRQYLEQRQSAGDFTIYRKDLEDEFWRYFTIDALHDFYEPGSVEENRAFKTPLWQTTAVEKADDEIEKVTDEKRPVLLAGTHWRLLQFQSMDDAIGEIRPENPSLYDMTLNADGTVQMQLNCNRAMGTWLAEPATDGTSGRFTFGALATTKALCPPPSMDERIARDAQHIRGFLLREDKLYLSLKADAGIYAWQRLEQQARQASPPLSPEDGGPRNWEVTGVSVGANLRQQPSTSAQILTKLPRGTILDNLGCENVAVRDWCYVQPLGGGPVGYVAADVLQPAVSPNGRVMTGPDDSALRAGQGLFDATGTIPCAQQPGQPLMACEFGVARAGGGYATVVVTKPDSVKRAIYFRMGRALGADTSQADGYPEFWARKENDLHIIRIGSERYEIPDAVILGG